VCYIRGFSFYDVDYYNAYMSVPSALLYKTTELAYFMGNYYINLYEDYLVN
jgi:hypothetical protein